jgi:hypothetical protein
MHQATMGDAPQGFSELCELFKGDARKLGLVTRLLYHSVLMDLQRLERAADDGDWQSVCSLAQRISLDCAQVSEHRAEFALCSLARVRNAGAMRKDYRLYREDLARLSDYAQSVVDRYVSETDSIRATTD